MCPLSLRSILLLLRKFYRSQGLKRHLQAIKLNRSNSDIKRGGQRAVHFDGDVFGMDAKEEPTRMY